MKITALQLSILDEVVEDYTQLWEIEEIVKAANRELLPNTARKVAMSAILGLADEGLLEFFVGTSFAGEEKPLPTDGIGDLLAEEQQWNPLLPSRIPSIRVGATEKGMALSYGGPEKRDRALMPEGTEPG